MGCDTVSHLYDIELVTFVTKSKYLFVFVIVQQNCLRNTAFLVNKYILSPIIGQYLRPPVRTLDMNRS